MKKEKGITLVALVITIIVMLILAGVAIYYATTELLTKTKYSKFIDEMAKVKENITRKALEIKIDEAKGEVASVFSAAPTTQEWNNINSQLKYEMLYNRDKQVGTEENKLPTAEYYGNVVFEEETNTEGQATGKIKDIFYVDKELTNKDEKAYLYDKQNSEVYRIEPEIIEGVPAYSNGLGNLLIGNSGLLGKIQDSINKPPKPNISTGKYELSNGEYMCLPNLTGFRENTTYYVTWNEAGEEARMPITGEPPTDWYNYSKKKWANIVTVNNGKEAYFTWIPRYVYKSIQGQQLFDIKFVDINNLAKDNRGDNIDYIGQGYLQPEGFQFGETKTSGIWVGKYQVAGNYQVPGNYEIKPNANILTSTVINDFFIGIRKMESIGEALGLEETINEETGEAISSSNNIDIHMSKNTEYGIILMLTASKYGTPVSGSNVTASTTGNIFGIYQVGDNPTWEYVAGIYNGSTSYEQNYNKLKNAPDRYVDKYENTSNDTGDSTGYKLGDASVETRNWYGSTFSYFVYSDRPVFLRAWEGMFNLFVWDGGFGSPPSCISSRAIIVNGEGI